MECRDNKLLIEAYWDRHLPAEMARQVERHLRSCPACRAEYGPVDVLLSEPEPVATPAGLRDRIMAAVAPLDMPATQSARPPFQTRRWMEWMQAPWAGALAACVGLVLMGLIVAQMGTRQPDVGAIAEGPLPAAEPSPLAVAGWAQAMTLPGRLNTLPALAQAAVLEQVARPPAPPAITLRDRPLDLPPPENPSILLEWPVIFAGLSTLGA